MICSPGGGEGPNIRDQREGACFLYLPWEAQATSSRKSGKGGGTSRSIPQKRGGGEEKKEIVAVKSSSLSSKRGTGEPNGYAKG